MIGDRYELGPIVGTGAFATVHEATDLRLDSLVAIKVLAQNWAADPAVCERFGREATLLRRVRSSHRNAPLAEVFDIDQTEDGRPYFVMSFADRGTLASRWSVGNAWPVERVIPVLNTLADGLHALHSAGVVHRDIKPSNMLYVTQPDAPNGEQLLIGDLGLAKDTLTATSDFTVAGGTPGYMAPEQRYPDSQITAAADVYSATVVISELLTGIRGPSGIAELPAHWRAEFNRGVHEIPHERHQSIATWRAALVEVIGTTVAQTSMSVGAPPAVPAQPPPPPPPVSNQPPTPSPPVAEASRTDPGIAASAPIAAAPVVQTTPPDADQPVAAAESKRGRTSRLKAIALSCLLLVALAAAGFYVLAGRTVDDRIAGPEQARVGETIFLRPDLPEGAVSHVWVVAGQRINDSDLELTPQSAGSVTIQLEITDSSGAVETDTHVVSVSP